MEAGIEHLGRKTAESVDAMIVVVEPGLKSIETAERIKKTSNRHRYQEGSCYFK
ncbi:hypothetical protein [Methanobrevibacter arboriphilus]|uniref:hypothetical protein n=1 Tax=Methanobrevibacter arboriphilus TaxID=39441 RepID=UPI000A563E23|nr:hypothetical protein [Methanobrevibacter arboriphilus]